MAGQQTPGAITESGQAHPAVDSGTAPVTAPDQHKPTNIRLLRIAGVVSILVLLTMTRPFANHQSASEDVALILVAAIIAAVLIGDAVLRRNGLRR